jgi:hypothetical protein
MVRNVNNKWEKHRLPIGHVDEKVGKDIVFIKFKNGKREMIVMDKKTYKERQKYKATFLMWLFLLCVCGVESIYIYQVTHYSGLWLFLLFLFSIILILLLENLIKLRSGSQRREKW